LIDKKNMSTIKYIFLLCFSFLGYIFFSCLVFLSNIFTGKDDFTDAELEYALKHNLGGIRLKK